MPEKKVYLNPWMMGQSIILVSGQRGVGKSWFIVSLLMAITKRQPFGPWSVTNSVPTLYLDGEMAAQDIQERLVTLDQTSEKESPLHIYCDAYAASQGLPRANLLNPEWRKAIKNLLLELGVKVWALDNIASLTPGIDENSKQEWDPINQWLLELRFNEITTILAHHTNRSGGQRGTSGREDNIDISILLKHPEGYTAEDGASFIASFTKARIATSHLSKIADTAFRMELDPAGKTVWTWRAVRQQLKEQILALHSEGVKPKDIANELKCSHQNVYRTIKKHENR
jgi:putative DNA primase/helicase